MRRATGTRRLAITAAVVAAVAAAATGCSSGSKQSATPTPSGTPLYTPSPCPTPKQAAKPVWPASMPADLPKPAVATNITTTTTGDGVHVTRYTTPTSLRESVLFIVQSYGKAGYTLGRGDAEATEADAPFVHGDTRGVTRLASLAQCQTLWLTATVKAATGPSSPLLPSRTPSASSSPLPFG